MIKLSIAKTEDKDKDIKTSCCYKGNGLDILSEFCIIVDKFLNDFSDGDKELKEDILDITVHSIKRKWSEFDE